MIGVTLWTLSALVIALCVVRARDVGEDISSLDRADGVGGEPR